MQVNKYIAVESRNKVRQWKRDFSSFIKIGLWLLPWLFLFILTISPIEAYAQQEKGEKRDLGGVVIVDPIKKEEIHRYMGYERLLPKYISLPYDVNMNTNVQGAYIDIGYLFLMFLPILLIFGIKDNRVRIALMALLTLFLLFSVTTGYSAFHKIAVADAAKHVQDQVSSNSFTAAPLVYLKLKLTQLFCFIYLPIESLITPVSGEGDFITLPILFVLFSLFMYLIKDALAASTFKAVHLIPFFSLYGLLWMLLGAGIAWYGILLSAGAGIVLVLFANKFLSKKWYEIPFLILIFFWFFIGFSTRSTDYELSPDLKVHPSAVYSMSLVYGTNKYNKTQAIQATFPSYKQALNEINANPSILVYRVGTFIHYFITDNDKRVMVDNQLGVFRSFSQEFNDKRQLTEAFKKNNYGYFVVDLNTASIDLTPDKSLTKKFQDFLNFLNNNSKIQLIASDRVVQNGQVQSSGSFAVFKIL